MIQKSILVASLIGLGLIFSLNQTAFAQDYVNEEFGYSITPPQNWVTSTIGSPGSEAVLFTQNEEYQGEFAPYFTLERIVDEKLSFDPNYDLESIEQSMEDGYAELIKSDEYLGYTIIGVEASERQDGWTGVVRGNLLVNDGADGLPTNFASVTLALKSNETYLFWFFASPEDYATSILKFTDAYETFTYQLNFEEDQVGPTNDSPLLVEHELAYFVDPDKDPTYYLNRYYGEPAYKDWFDKNYPGLTIEEAVGYEPTQNSFVADAPTDKEFVAVAQEEVDDFTFFDNPFYWMGWYGMKFLIYGVPVLVVFIILIKIRKSFSRGKKDSMPKESEPSTLDNYV